MRTRLQIECCWIFCLKGKQLNGMVGQAQLSLDQMENKIKEMCQFTCETQFYLVASNILVLVTSCLSSTNPV